MVVTPIITASHLPEPCAIAVAKIQECYAFKYLATELSNLGIVYTVEYMMIVI